MFQPAGMHLRLYSTNGQPGSMCHPGAEQDLMSLYLGTILGSLQVLCSPRTWQDQLQRSIETEELCSENSEDG